MSGIANYINSFVSSYTTPYIFGQSGGGGGFAPTDLPNIELWLDASNISSITKTGDFVETWADLSGNGYDAVKVNDATRPSSGTRNINSLNVIDFLDSANERLDLDNTPINTAALGDNTCFIVFSTDDIARSQFLVSADQSGGAWSMNIDYDASSAVKYFSGGQEGHNVTKDTSVHIMIGRRTGTALITGLDGATTSNTNGSDRVVTADSTIGQGTLGGSSSTLDGVIAEIILYSDSKGTDDANVIGNYLADKWNATWVNLS